MLTSKQRAYLRSLANTLDTIGQVGKEGITENVTEQAKNAIKAREIIKFRVLETAMMTAKEAAERMAAALNAEVVQCIGSRFVLYKRNPQNVQITLPKE